MVNIDARAQQSLIASSLLKPSPLILSEIFVGLLECAPHQNVCMALIYGEIVGDLRLENPAADSTD